MVTLQSDLDNVTTWCSRWHMNLNTSKCKFMRISRSKVSFSNYHLNSIPLEAVSFYKYLGVHITNNLSWKRHIEHITSKANRMLGYIKRNFALTSSPLKKQLYVTYIRPNLEYASSVWDPHQLTLINSLEAVQNRSVRFILNNYQRTASVTSMKLALNISLLSKRRKIARLCLFHKIYHLIPTLKSRFIEPASFTSARLDHRHKVNIPFHKTSTYGNSFLPKSCQEWNHLPDPLVYITNTDDFRKALTNVI